DHRQSLAQAGRRDGARGRRPRAPREPHRARRRLKEGTPMDLAKDVTLYHYWRSSSPWRVRWALGLKGVKAQLVAINLLTDENESAAHRARNPMGYVPVLSVGTRHLIESMAIIEWLDETRPEPRLLPGDTFDRAHVRALCELINAGTQPL